MTNAREVVCTPRSYQDKLPNDNFNADNDLAVGLPAQQHLISHKYKDTAHANMRNAINQVVPSVANGVAFDTHTQHTHKIYRLSREVN